MFAKPGIFMMIFGNARWIMKIPYFIVLTHLDLATNISASILTAVILRLATDQKSIKMTCEYYEKCVFIQKVIKAEPVPAWIVMNSYCESDKYGCARYCLFRIVGADHVPDHLWPSDETETKEVIEDKFRMNH
jgi:hypothetical protein